MEDEFCTNNCMTFSRLAKPKQSSRDYEFTGPLVLDSTVTISKHRLIMMTVMEECLYNDREDDTYVKEVGMGHMKL